MSCRACPRAVPVVSLGLAQRVVAGIPPERRLGVFVVALEWLVMHNEGLTREGIHGRPYTQEEKAAIARELGAIEGLRCPFMPNGETCLLGKLPDVSHESEVGKAPYLWLPTALAKLIDLDTFREVVRRREVADAKVATMSRNEALY